MPRKEIVDSFVTESGKRLIQLVYLRGLGVHKHWQIEVYMQRSGQKPILISTSEYHTEVVARGDFELRRPRMREEREEVPMQRGKRLVQEMLQEKLGEDRRE